MWIILNNSGDKTIYGRLDDDGLIRVTCIAEYPEFSAWIAEGNNPEVIEL